MAIYFFIAFIKTDLFSGTYLVMSDQISLVTKIGYILSKLLFLSILYLLWFKSAQIASLINRSLNIENLLDKEIDYRNLFQILIALTGIIILVKAAPDFIKYILESSSSNNYTIKKELPNIVSRVLELGLGGFLFLRAANLTKYTFDNILNNF